MVIIVGYGPLKPLIFCLNLRISLSARFSPFVVIIKETPYVNRDPKGGNGRQKCTMGNHLFGDLFTRHRAHIWQYWAAPGGTAPGRKWRPGWQPHPWSPSARRNPPATLQAIGSTRPVWRLLRICCHTMGVVFKRKKPCNLLFTPADLWIGAPLLVTAVRVDSHPAAGDFDIKLIGGKRFSRVGDEGQQGFSCKVSLEIQQNAVATVRHIHAA